MFWYLFRDGDRINWFVADQPFADEPVDGPRLVLDSEDRARLIEVFQQAAIHRPSRIDTGLLYNLMKMDPEDTRGPGHFLKDQVSSELVAALPVGGGSLMAWDVKPYDEEDENMQPHVHMVVRDKRKKYSVDMTPAQLLFIAEMLSQPKAAEAMRRRR